MGKMFENMGSEGLEETQDRLGGFQPFETDIYTGTVKLFYALKSQGGANAIYFAADIGGKEYRETIYFTNRDGDNFFLNKDDKSKKVPLPGFTLVDDLALCVTGQPFKDLEFEEKVVNVYDPDQKKELPKAVQMATGMLGQKVSLGIVKNLENKTKKNESTGKYEPTAETRDTNTIEKVFHTESRGTTVEARNNQDPGAFWDAWLERNKGNTRDRREIKDGQGGASGRPAGGPPQGGQAAAAPARQSLFGNKG